jgi:hypothetical protein
MATQITTLSARLNSGSVAFFKGNHTFFRRRDMEALFGLQKRPSHPPHAPHRGRPRQQRTRRGARRCWCAGWNKCSRTLLLLPNGNAVTKVIGRIVDLKAEAAARAIKIILPDRAPSNDLPDGVSLQPGLLTVSFDHEQQLHVRSPCKSLILRWHVRIISWSRQSQELWPLVATTLSNDSARAA